MEVVLSHLYFSPPYLPVTVMMLPGSQKGGIDWGKLQDTSMVSWGVAASGVRALRCGWRLRLR